MRQVIAWVGVLALFCAACGQPSTSGAGAGPESASEGTTAPSHVSTLPQVDPALVSTPNSEFTAVEATELGVIGAPTVEEALGPLVSTETTEGDQVVFKRPLGIPRDSIVLPAGYEIVSCSVATQVLRETDGRLKLAFVNPGSGGQLEVTIRAKKLKV